MKHSFAAVRREAFGVRRLAGAFSIPILAPSRKKNGSNLPHSKHFARAREEVSRLPLVILDAFRVVFTPSGDFCYLISCIYPFGLPDAFGSAVNFVLKVLEFQVALLFQFGEIILLIAYVLVPVFLLGRSGRSAIALTATVVCAFAIVLHCFGFKVFGRPVTASIERLERPKRVARLEAPNIVRFADGSSVALADVFFPRPIDPAETQPGYYDTIRGGLRADILLDRVDPKRGGISVEVKTNASGTAQLIYLRHASYWCGNTWTPHPFPSRLPKQVRDNFAVLLISSGLAMPTAEYVESSKPYDKITGALARGMTFDLPLGHSEIERLGMTLIRKGLRDKGIELLILTRATNVLPQLTRTLQEEISTKARDGSLDPATSNALASSLLQLDGSAALTALRARMSTAEPDVHQLWSLANVAARIGDLTGFDALCDMVRDESASKWSKQLAHTLTSHFRFDIYLNGGGCPDDIALEFLAWYDSVRPRVSYTYSSDHREGFAIDSGSPFTPAYYASMRAYKERIAERHGRAIYKERFFD